MRRLVAASVAMALMSACGGGSPESGATPPAATGGGAAQSPAAGTPPAGSAAQGISDMAKGMQEVAKGFQQLQGSAKPVDFEQLITVLNEVDGWKRSEPRGEQMNMPVSFSTAEARYQRDESQVYVKVQDSALSQLLMAPYSMFLRSGFEERSSDGYKRASAFDGNPGFEEWNSRNNSGEVTVIVGQRFIVTGRGTRVENLDVVKGVVRSLGLSKLPAIAAAAPK